MSDNKIDIFVVVGGKRVPMTVNENQPLKALFQKAISEAKVAGEQKLDDWEFKNEGGDVFDSDKKIGELGIIAGFTLFLSQKVGATG